MIETELQYRITRQELEQFEQALAHLHTSGVGHDEDPLMLQVWHDSFASMIEDLRGQIAVYEAAHVSPARTSSSADGATP